jgi:hypothetical protein
MNKYDEFPLTNSSSIYKDVPKFELVQHQKLWIKIKIVHKRKPFTQFYLQKGVGSVSSNAPFCMYKNYDPQLILLINKSTLFASEVPISFNFKYYFIF